MPRRSLKFYFIRDLEWLFYLDFCFNRFYRILGLKTHLTIQTSSELMRKTNSYTKKRLIQPLFQYTHDKLLNLPTSLFKMFGIWCHGYCYPVVKTHIAGYYTSCRRIVQVSISNDTEDLCWDIEYDKRTLDIPEQLAVQTGPSCNPVSGILNTGWVPRDTYHIAIHTL